MIYKFRRKILRFTLKVSIPTCTLCLICVPLKYQKQNSLNFHLQICLSYQSSILAISMTLIKLAISRSIPRQINIFQVVFIVYKATTSSNHVSKVWLHCVLEYPFMILYLNYLVLFYGFLSVYQKILLRIHNYDFYKFHWKI